MNAARRKAIAAIGDELQSCFDRLDAIKDEERDAFDAMPESLQASDRGLACENAADALDDAVSSLQEAMSCLSIAAE